MSSIRLPRTNFSNPADQDDDADMLHEMSRPVPPGPDAPDGQRNAGPAWQSNFYMAPNVRFTRTPEVQIRKLPPIDESAPRPRAAAPAPAPIAPMQAAAPASRTTAARPAAPATPAPAAPPQAKETTPPHAGVRGWADLSDHAFSELAEPSLAADTPAPPARPSIRHPAAGRPGPAATAA